MSDGKPLPIDRELVDEFVLVAHSNLEVVKRLLESEPALVNCARDWGEGDWETGVPRRMSAGARLRCTCSTAARGWTSSRPQCSARLRSCGRLAMLAARPELRDARGPHGIPLVKHAEAGGDEARAVLELLRREAAPV